MYVWGLLGRIGSSSAGRLEIQNHNFLRSITKGYHGVQTQQKLQLVLYFDSLLFRESEVKFYDDDPNQDPVRKKW